MKKVDSSSETTARFVARMFEMPALRSLPALQREEQALQFLRANGQQLQPLLASMGLGSASDWRAAADALSREMKAYADKLLEAELARAVDRRISLAFYPVLAGGRQTPPSVREDLAALCRKMSAHPVARRALSGSLAAVLSDLTDKYIPPAWESRKYIYGEVTRVQRLGLDAEQCSDLLRVLMLLRPAAYLQTTPGPDLSRDTGFTPVPEQALQRILPGVSTQAASVPAAVVRLALRSVLPFPQTEDLEAASRLAAIFTHRGRSLAPSLVVDRGADTPDKSWFNVARRNARWHGLDPRMLDELYTIAAEHRW